MSEQSKSARAAMRAKANRLGNSKSPGKVDASDWSPGSPLNADKKTGARPVRSRIYKYGGSIQGDRGPKNAGRTARKNGGSVLGDGMSKAAKAADTDQSDREYIAQRQAKDKAKAAQPRKDGGKVNDKPASGGALNVHSTVDENKKEKGSFHEGGYKKGGRAERCDGGAMKGGGKVSIKRAAQSDIPSKGRAQGKSASDSGEGTTLRRAQAIKQDERAKRKAGGRAKGKTNINIVIGSPGGDKPPPLMPQMPVRPPPPPPMAPPPGPPPGGPPPGMAGPPPGGLPMGGPGMPPPPMMRRSGGRTVHMTAGAGSGPGRLEKTKLQKNASA